MILPDTERHPSNPGPTHAVDILAFVEAQEIPQTYFETPYYLAPVPGGEAAYAQLREALIRSKKIGIAYVEIQARQHLAAVVPQGQSLVLNTLRWTSEAGSLRHFGRSEADRIATRELAMMALPVAARRAWIIASSRERGLGFAVPAEYTMKRSKAPQTTVDEADDAEDEDSAADDYLAAVFKRTPHPVDGNAVRRRTCSPARQRDRGLRVSARRR